MVREVPLGKISIGAGKLILIAGPDVIESEKSCLRHAEAISRIAGRYGLPFIFKCSYDKANRTSLRGYRGPGLKEGLRILDIVKKRVGVPVLSDVHCVDQVEPAAQVLDCIQIPAFLSRQTDLLLAAGRTGRVINVKKGQFLAPWDMRPVVEKIASTGNRKILLTERGTVFGYNMLVNDMRSLAILRSLGYPVVFDAGHSTQLPGGLKSASGGQPQYIPLLARAAVAAGCDAVFVEVHENPAKALCDGPSSLPLKKLAPMLSDLSAIRKAVGR
ncbi:MAG: 3-deoxy-8-phosphooctulonate synthase [Candidatus Omnitrophica bacterium]|nr:3-deoxy-8-phosphooctulonate synthase [Candidatus Omnitrophota bacterium]